MIRDAAYAGVFAALVICAGMVVSGGYAPEVVITLPCLLRMAAYWSPHTTARQR